MNFSCWGCRCGKFIIYRKYVICTMICWAYILINSTIYGIPAIIDYKIPVEKEHDFDDFEHHNDTEVLVCRKKSDEVPHTQPLVKIRWKEDNERTIFLSSYIGFLIFHTPGGIISDKFGAKYVLSLGVLASALLTCAVPTVLTLSEWRFTALLQFTLGCCQGVIYPASVSLVSQWVPRSQITLLLAYATSGTCLARVFCYIFLPIFANQIKHWESFFYLSAVLSIGWFSIFQYLVYSQAAKDSFATFTEKQVMEKEVGLLMPRNIPWKNILRHGGVWALFFGEMGVSMLSYGVHAYYPLFCKKVLGVRLDENLSMFAGPYIYMWIFIMGASALANILIAKKYIPVLYIRTIYASVGCLLPSITILLSSYAGCDKSLLMTGFTFTLIAKSAIYSAFEPNILDITRHYSGCVYAIHKGLPGSVGALGPILSRVLRSDNTIEEWRKFFWLICTIIVFTTTIYLIYLSSDKAKWDFVVHYDPESEKRKAYTKSVTENVKSKGKRKKNGNQQVNV